MQSLIKVNGIKVDANEFWDSVCFKFFIMKIFYLLIVLIIAALSEAVDFDVGCWSDSSSDRTFRGPSYSDSYGMTRQACASFCESNGMPFSGTQYAEECFCSPTAPTSAHANWCNMPCTGNENEICGSGNALSVILRDHQYNNLHRTNLGCFADAESFRTMTGPRFNSYALTNAACSAFCTAQGHQYAGTQYGWECYCSTTSPWSVSRGCGMGCSGNPSEICGDGGALSVTLTTNGPPPPPPPPNWSWNRNVDMNARFSSWSSWKARGVNLGNWLLLEKWMYPSWFEANAPNARDEWTFCQSLGKARCTSVLQQHWASFITLDDIAELNNMGYNTLRIPVGFWAFIDPLPTEPYVRSTQLQELNRVIGYAQSFGMTVIVNIHGLPGSQNGKDHSGRDGPVEWFTYENQQRSFHAVQVAADWIRNSGYAGNTISALQVANEPELANWDRWLAYKDYLLSCHNIIRSTIPSVAMMFHDGFWDMKPWNRFFNTGDNVVLDTHQYWAFWPTTLEQAKHEICANVDTFKSMNMPVFVGEFSLSVWDIHFGDYAMGYYETQMHAWLQAAGGAFWSMKAFNWDGQTHNAAWSTRGILHTGKFNKNNFWQLGLSSC